MGIKWTDSHADRRDAQRRKAQRGMQVTGRSIKSVLLPTIAKKGAQVARREPRTRR